MQLVGIACIKYALFPALNRSTLHWTEIALERNREMYRTSKDASQRSQLLSSTLQQISVEHEQSIQSLRNQLLAHETQNQAMGQKLHVASTEIEKGQMGYRVLENKLTEERTRREV